MLDQTLFTIFGREVKMYGICIAVGILVCLVVFFIYTKQKKMPAIMQDFSFFVAIIAIVAGFAFGVLYQSVYIWISEGVFTYSGITVMGGLIGGAAAFIIAYFVGGKLYFTGNNLGLHKREFNKILLVAPCCITVAHAFGRLGCLCAGCCYGIESNTGFTLYIHGANRIPVQLYESIFLFVLFAVLSVLYFKRCNILMQIYLIAYGIWRSIIEYYRGDVSERGFFLGLFPSQWQSILFVAAGVGLLIFYAVKKIPYFLPKEEPVAAVAANGEGTVETGVAAGEQAEQKSDGEQTDAKEDDNK